MGNTWQTPAIPTGDRVASFFRHVPRRFFCLFGSVETKKEKYTQTICKNVKR